MQESIDLVLNDLSFKPLPSLQEAKDKMSDLIQALSVFSAFGVEGALRCSDMLFSSLLWENYTVAQWSNDSSVETDQRTLFKTKATKYPYLQDKPLEEARNLGCDFRIYDGISCEALGAAYLLDSPALSLLSNGIWDAEKLIIQVEELDEEGDVVKFDEEVIHASNYSHVISHKEWIKQKRSSPIKDGSDLWQNRTILFPNIEFCVEVEKQLEKLSVPAHIHQVRVRLEALNEYNDEWTQERMFAVLPDFSGESDTTLNKYRDARTFTRLDGELVFCEVHMKLKKSFNWRIHFFIDFENRRFIVGYIGPHLPI